MKEYIKKFESATSADNYSIVDIPFTTSVKPSSTYPSIDYVQNLVCNQTGKKLVNNNGIVSIYSDEPVIPNDEIWYTTTDGEPIDLGGGGSGSGSGSGSGGGWPEYTNTYEGGKGVIKFTEDLTEIPIDGFLNIENLETIILPNSVTSIGNSAFYGCTGLTSVTIGNSVTSIGISAFYKCTGLSSVTIPDSVTSIEWSAFGNCSSLTSIIIPDNVTSIGLWVFDNCTSLTSPVYNAHVFAFMPTSYSGAYTIPDGIESIAGTAFYNCSGLTSVTIANSVTYIGDCAFYDCKKLTSVTIGDKTYQKQTVTNGKCKAYKAFNADMKCRGFQYEEGKTYEFEGEPKLCVCGFHASLNLLNVFTYYWGKLGKDIVVHEVELEGVTDENNEFDSKVVAKKITIGKRIL